MFTVQSSRSIDIQQLFIAGSDPPQVIAGSAGFDEMHPSWSPDGKKLLFTRRASPKGDLNLWLVDFTNQDTGQDTGQPTASLRQLTDWPGDELAAAWSPDGKQIALLASRQSEPTDAFEIWVIETESGANAARRVAMNAAASARSSALDRVYGPVWSPVGRTLFYVSRSLVGQTVNPIAWLHIDGTASGMLDTGTQENAEIAIRPARSGASGRTLTLAFGARGRSGSPRTDWMQLYLFELDPAEFPSETSAARSPDR